jgi:hypothetical protein
MSDLSTTDHIEDVRIIFGKRMAEDKERRTFASTCRAHSYKTLETVMKISAVLDLREFAVAITLSHEKRKEVAFQGVVSLVHKSNACIYPSVLLKLMTSIEQV